MRAAADLATGSAEQHQHQPDDDQDDADGPEERNGEHRTEKKEDESSNDHAGAVPVHTGKQTDSGPKLTGRDQRLLWERLEGRTTPQGESVLSLAVTRRSLPRDVARCVGGRTDRRPRWSQSVPQPAARPQHGGEPT